MSSKTDTLIKMTIPKESPDRGKGDKHSPIIHTSLLVALAKTGAIKTQISLSGTEKLSMSFLLIKIINKS